MAKSDIITRAKIESEQWTKGMRGMSSELDKFRAKSKGMSSEGMALDKVLGGLKSGFGAIAGAVGVGLTAMEAFNKTVQSSEVLVDLMGSTMRQANAVVDSFFASVATGDFSNFVNGLDDIARHAREAYEAVDALGTLKMFQSPQAARINADIAEQRAILRNPKASAEQKKAAQAQLEKLTQEMYEMSGELQEQARDAFRKTIREALVSQGAAGVSDAEIDAFVRKNLSSKKAFDKMKDMLAWYEQQIARTQTDKWVYVNGQTMKMRDDTAESLRWKNSHVYKMMRAAATVNEKKIAEAFGYLTEAEQARGQAASTAASAYRMMGQNVGGRSGKAKVTPSSAPSFRDIMDIDGLRARVNAEAQKAFAEGMKQNTGIKGMGIVLPEEFQATEDVLARMKEKQLLYQQTTAKVQELQQALQYASETERPYLESSINMLTNMANAADPAAAKLAEMGKQAESLQNVATAAAAIGNAFAATGNKTMSAVGQMIGTFASLIATYAALKQQAAQAAVAQSGALPPPMNVVMIATTVAALVSAMATVSSFAQGGIVGGSNFADGISARVSSGEMVINEADQRRLFDAIHSGNVGGGGGNSYISGEQIVTVVNAYGRRTGRGELIR